MSDKVYMPRDNVIMGDNIINTNSKDIIIKDWPYKVFKVPAGEWVNVDGVMKYKPHNLIDK